MKNILILIFCAFALSISSFSTVEKKNNVGKKDEFLFFRNLTALSGAMVTNPNHMDHATGLNIQNFPQQDLLETVNNLYAAEGYVVYDAGVYDMFKYITNGGQEQVDKAILKIQQEQGQHVKYLLTVIWLNTNNQVMDFKLYGNYGDDITEEMMSEAEKAALLTQAGFEMNNYQENNVVEEMFNAEENGLVKFMSTLDAYRNGEVEKSIEFPENAIDGLSNQDFDNGPGYFFLSPAGLPFTLPENSSVAFIPSATNPATFRGCVWKFTIVDASNQSTLYIAKHDGNGNFTGYSPPGAKSGEQQAAICYKYDASHRPSQGSLIDIIAGYKVKNGDCDWLVTARDVDNIDLIKIALGINTPLDLGARGVIRITTPISATIQINEDIKYNSGADLSLAENIVALPNCLDPITYDQMFNNDDVSIRFYPDGGIMYVVPSQQPGLPPDKIYANTLNGGTELFYLKYNPVELTWDLFDAPQDNSCYVCELLSIFTGISAALADGHLVLDVIGVVPGVGEIADAVNGVLYILEGEAGMALLCFAAAIPVAGIAITGGKYVASISGKAKNIKHIVYKNLDGAWVKSVNNLSELQNQLVNSGFQVSKVKDFLSDFSRNKALLVKFSNDHLGIFKAYDVLHGFVNFRKQEWCVDLMDAFRKKFPAKTPAEIVDGVQNFGVARYCISGLGCFIKHTPVLMASNPVKNFATGLALSATTIVAVPIQKVQLLDYALAHKTVNATYSLTASTDDEVYLGLLNNDPYTSDQQRARDKYELDDENWNEVVFEEVNGSSIARLALHHDWINQKGYQVDAVVNMNLPEQGISGSFRITSIKHIIPQKKPVDDDESDDYEYRPVTALFTHVSDQVYDISFDNGENVGVTFQHPVYSVTAGDWRLAGELEVGERVLTKAGETKVIIKEKKEGAETVYNLEVKELHNFLVGVDGVLVHNNYNIAEAIVAAMIAAIPEAYKQFDKCKQYAKALRQQLIANGVDKPKCFVAKVVDDAGRRHLLPLWHNGQEIATNGIHVFTPVNGKVYDNINHNGLEVSLEDYTIVSYDLSGEGFETLSNYHVVFREIKEGEDILYLND